MASSDGDFFFQELVRTLDATLDGVNPAGRSNGQNALAIMRWLYRFPGMAARLSPEFEQVLCEHAMTAVPDRTSNVRLPVKHCLVWPRAVGEYPPWSELPGVDETRLAATREVADKYVAFQITVVDNKVYALYVDTDAGNIVDGFYAACGLRAPWVKNDEGYHVTLVNSDVVARIGVERVRAFVDKHGGAPFTLTTGAVKCTFSEDWPRFGWCAVVQVQSPHMAVFLGAFNATFGTSLHPSPHVTFAMVPRDLTPMLIRRRSIVQ
jgi:hypothetical protein